MEKHDVVVIGAGPAGLSAAAAAYDAGAKVLLLDRESAPGGILRQCIHPGFGLHTLGQELTGPEYGAHYAQEAENRGIPLYRDTTVIDLSPERLVTVQSPEGLRQIQAGAVVLAMGCRERSRGALGIPGTRPAGVYTAGTAQKLINSLGFLPGKRVVILGSGDIGLIMARRMTLEGAKVEAVCEIMPYPGGLTRNIVQCLEDFGIPLYLSTTVEEIHGKERVEGVTLVEVDGQRRPIPATRRFVACDTLLLSVGLIPENELSRQAGVPLDNITGGPLVDSRCQTRVPGIFACGNVLQVHDLVDYVTQEGERAGKAAAAFALGKSRRKETLPVEPGEGIRYVVPQSLTPGEEGVLSFRVSKPCGAVVYRVRAGEQVLRQVRRPRAVPGEMERIPLSRELTAHVREPIRIEMEVAK